METKNNINSKKQLFSLISLLFFVFVVNALLKGSEQDYDLDEKDVKFINTYKKAGYIVWALTFLIILLYVLYFTKFNSPVLLYIIYGLLVFLVLYIFYNVFLIYSDKPAFVFSKSSIKEIKVEKVESGNLDFIFLYIPFLNFYVYLKKRYTKEQEYRLKESNLIYFLMGFFGVLGIFFPVFINVFYLLVVFVIVRVVSLFFGIDFVPNSIKEKIYYAYEKTPVEIFAYIEAFFYFIIGNMFLVARGKKTNSYTKYLFNSKEIFKYEYDQKTILKNWKKYLFLILSYVVLIIFLIYLFYKGYRSFYPVLNLFVVILFSSYLLLPVYVNKKLYFIPFISILLAKITRSF